MSRFLESLNLVLVLLIGGLCVFQWTRERELSGRYQALDTTARAQADEISRQKEDLSAANEDIAGFKTQITSLQKQTEEQVAKIGRQTAELRELQLAKDHFEKESGARGKALEEFQSAVDLRDKNIQTLLSQREQLLNANKDAATKANQAITAFNDLNGKYADVVNKFNQLATRYKEEKEAAIAAASQNR